MIFTFALLGLEVFTGVALAFRKSTLEHVTLPDLLQAVAAVVAVHSLWQLELVPDLVGCAAAVLATGWMWTVQIRGPLPGPYLLDVRGKNIIVTGSSSGIGEATAAQLAARGAHVILACRSEERAMVSLQRIVAKTCNPDVRFAALDMCSFASVRAFARARVNEGFPIDVLVCNAGVMRPERGETGDGVEITMQVNHYSNYLLTRLLLPLLRRATLPGGGRVVCVNSSVMKSACFLDGGFNFKDANQSAGRYTMFRAYGQSKLANALFAAELTRRLRRTGEEGGAPVCVNALMPGSIKTNVVRDLHWLLRQGQHLIAPWNKSTTAGAYTTVHLATAGEVTGVSGEWFEHCKVTPAPVKSRDPADSARLWEDSAKVVGLPAELQ